MAQKALSRSIVAGPSIPEGHDASSRCFSVSNGGGRVLFWPSATSASFRRRSPHLRGTRPSRRGRGARGRGVGSHATVSTASRQRGIASTPSRRSSQVEAHSSRRVSTRAVSYFCSKTPERRAAPPSRDVTPRCWSSRRRLFLKFRAPLNRHAPSTRRTQRPPSLTSLRSPHHTRAPDIWIRGAVP